MKRAGALVFTILLAIGVFVFLKMRSEKSWSPPVRPNIVLISIDTLRADHLELYGYNKKTAPAISKLASEGICYQHAISQAPWTLASMASVHTSLYPREHGAVEAEAKIGDDLVTIAEALNRSGYSTMAVVSHSFVGTKHGFAQGFQKFDESQALGHNAVTSKALTRIAVNFLQASHGPFFLWVHYFDPHFSYVRHPEFAFASDYAGPLPNKLSAAALRRREKRGELSESDLRYIKGVYDEEVGFTDFWISKLIEQIKKSGLEKSTVIIVTSDHGEYFLERGRFFHGKDVYEVLVHVPLIISGAIDPKLRGTMIERSVELTGIPKTILALTGIRNHHFQGENLLALDRDEDSRFVFTEGSYAWGTNKRKAAVLYKGWKLIRDLDDGTHELYEFSVDREERSNRWNDSRQQTVKWKNLLKARLDQFALKKEKVAPKIELNEEEQERLRALGYVQ